MINKGVIEAEEALDILVSYAIAEEGTNTLYLSLVDTLMTRRGDTYTMVEAEMILNYFPHTIWKHEMTLARLRDGFYYPILQLVKSELDLT